MITSRALRLDAETWRALAERLREDGRVLLFAGEADPGLPPVLSARGAVKLAGSAKRRILVLGRAF